MIKLILKSKRKRCFMKNKLKILKRKMKNCILLMREMIRSLWKIINLINKMEPIKIDIKNDTL